jgi:hypothetical protein
MLPTQRTIRNNRPSAGLVPEKLGFVMATKRLKRPRDPIQLGKLADRLVG